MTPRVVLVGLPGTGKSTSGKRLAKILHVGFADSDELVQARDGRPIATIFAESGEAAFRAAEHAVIAECLTGFDGVLSLGGGALTHEPTRELIAASGVAVAVLGAPLATLVDRLGDAHGRPLLADDPPARLATLLAERQPVYDSLASFRVDTDQRTPGQVAAHIAARLHDMGVLQ